MSEQTARTPVSGSFRDPSGFLFAQSDVLYRQVNEVYRDDYDLLMSSGLYTRLVEEGFLVPHEEMPADHADSPPAYKIIRPEVVEFISYPYEWCFSQLRDAALLTLAIQKIALEHGMTLKDASAYNIQFHQGRAVFIDTLSFEKYQEGSPWAAYRQFCQHFLAPLALMRYRDIRLNQLLRIYMDGVPLDMASALLPLTTRFRFSLYVHIHLHARTQKKYESKAVAKSKLTMKRTWLLGLIDSLESCTRKLKWRPGGTEWADYYEDTNYDSQAIEDKKTIVGRFLDQAGPQSVWDLGANTGMFSLVAGQRGLPTVSFDIDPAAVEKNYIRCRQAKDPHILPLVLDLTNPSGGIGWANTERMALERRGPVDTIMALALVHHLAISNNLPLAKIAAYFQRMCRTLIIEFVPKDDSQAQRLLASREDVFPDYTQEGFEAAFAPYFSVRQSAGVAHSKRTMYLMDAKTP